MSRFNLSAWSLRNRSLVVYLMIMAVVGGVVAFQLLGRNEDPPFTIRTMVVQVAWPGATLQETLLQVTERLERKLQEMEEVDSLRSYTKDGVTTVFVDLFSTVPADEVPAAWQRARAAVPGLELDLHELSPREALDQLYGRNLHVALLSAESIAGNRHSFSVLPITSDPHVLVVPEGIDLQGITAPDRELPAEARAMLNRCIQFNFGNIHTQRVEAWWRRVLPRHEVVAQCRTYDTALALVEAGLGVALVPLLTVQHGSRLLAGVRVYDTGIAPRRIVAVVPPQYLRLRPYDVFVQELEVAGRTLELLTPEPAPPFLQAKLAHAAE